MPRRITHEKVERSIDVGRCQVCAEEYATHVITIEGIFEHHMCDGCFKEFKEVLEQVRSQQMPYEELRVKEMVQGKRPQEVLVLEGR